jgi:hypothetical protein
MLSFKSFLLRESVSFKGNVYHGSGYRFNKFEQSKARVVNDFYGGGAAYFTDDVGVAITYAKSMAKKSKEDPVVYTVEIRINKMFDVDHIFTGKELTDILPGDLEDFARGAGLLGLNSDKYTVLANLKAGKVKLTGDEVFKGLSKGMNTTAKAREHLISKGYDGLRYNGGVNMGMAKKHNVYLVYDADNIKIIKRQVVKSK